MATGDSLKKESSSTGSFLQKVKSGVTSLAKKAGNSALQTMGVVEKGVIEIVDLGERQVKEENAQKPGGTGGSNRFNVGGFDTDLVSQYAETVNTAASNVMNAASNLAEGEKEGFGVSGNGAKKLRFEVPFNPKEITISGYGGEQMAVQDFSVKEDGKRSSYVGSVNSHIEMNIPLIFDKLNNKEAFYNENFALGTTSILRGVGKIGKDAFLKTKGKDNLYSVQPEVEAFTHVIRSNNKRLIRFTWGDMSYQGVLIGVQTEYTMFNINGEPCRANVQLRIVLLEPKDYPATVKIWTGKYKKNLPAKSAADTVVNQIGNLTNID